MKVNDIISYRQMCDEENVQTLQRGMNFRLGREYSVILMSQRANAPYADSIRADGSVIEYEGHDVPKSLETPDPKIIDQQITTRTGSLTQNGLFAKAIDNFKAGVRTAEIVRVYEKIYSGIWTFRGNFALIDYGFVFTGVRKVYRFILEFRSDQPRIEAGTTLPLNRMIPSEIKRFVWKRDQGRCKVCGATSNLHFDHIIPFSKGGTSLSAENIQVLCARHNLQKHDRIE